MNHSDFELAGGGALGRDHRTGFHNYQDAYFIQRDFTYPDRTIAVVTDGCSSGATAGSSRNEVGATLGARLFAKSLEMALSWHDEGNVFDAAVKSMLREISHISHYLGDRFKTVIQDHFLFTLTGVLLEKDTAYFFTLGDGVIFVNGKKYEAGPYNNTPPYAAYQLIESDIDPEDLKVQILEQLPLSSLDNFLIGCDGVNDYEKAWNKKLPGLETRVPFLCEFWEDDRYYNGNPDLISRKLRLISRDWPKKDPEPGLLPDDTTLIVGRRKKADD